jgi:uncharacterized phiE125 gp8 family phage protein
MILAAHWTRTVEPAFPVVDVDRLKAHVGVTHTDADELLEEYAAAAELMVEERCRVGLATQTWVLALEGWPTTIWLPRARVLQSVEVEYYDAAGDLQTLSADTYVENGYAEPAALTLADGRAWPALASRPDAVQVTYVVGWSSPLAVPALYQQAVRFLAGHYWANREAVLVGAMSKDLELTFASACDLAGVIRNDRPYVAA